MPVPFFLGHPVFIAFAYDPNYNNVADLLFPCVERTVYYYKSGTVYKNVKKTKPVYVCKDGWAPTGSECTSRKS